MHVCWAALCMVLRMVPAENGLHVSQGLVVLQCVGMRAAVLRAQAASCM